MNDLIRSHIWYEMVHAKYWEQYMSQYTGIKIDFRKWISIVILAFSVFGSVSWAFWKLFPEKAAVISSVCFFIIAVSQVIAAVKDTIVIDNEIVRKLCELRSQYIAYFNKLESLWLKYNMNMIDTETAMKEYYQLRETVYPIETAKDELNINKLKKADKKGIEQTNEYLKTRYNVNLSSSSSKTVEAVEDCDK